MSGRGGRSEAARRRGGALVLVCLAALALAAAGQAAAAGNLPSVVIDRPPNLAGRHEYATVSPTIRFGYTGSDPAGELAAPARVRTLFKRALLPDGGYCWGEYQFGQYREVLVGLSDPAWGAWQDYPDDPAERLVTLADLPLRDEQGQRIRYLFAVQVMDRAGAVSLPHEFGRDAVVFAVNEQASPLLWLAGEPLRGYEWAGTDGTVSLMVAPGQPLSLQWVGSGHNYSTEIAAYRYGWDVADLEDDHDPGWALPAGDSPAHRYAPARAFDAGVHSLTVRCWDLAGVMTQVVVVFDVVPIPDRADQRPLLLVDDVIDKTSNAWPGNITYITYDRDEVRDAFWLDALSDIAGFAAESDRFDCEEAQDLSFADLARYRAVIWAGKGFSGSFADQHFPPDRGRTYVWLEAYQQHAGNLLLVGQAVLRQFAGSVGCDAPGYDPGSTYAASLVLPLSFSYAGACVFSCPGTYLSRAWGFGTATLPDGTEFLLGPTLYPASSFGIDALDGTAHAEPYARCSPFRPRRSPCNGLKALTLDLGFRAAWPGAAGLPDTIPTARAIDWQDYPEPPAYPDLARNYLWSLDEFYDGNVVDPAQRPVVPRLLPDGRPAVEPMLRIHSRRDWIDALHAARGDPGWPENAYTEDQLRQICGDIGRTADGQPARVEGQATGFLSRVHEATKPGGRPDVCWGFDPSRFDPGPMRQVIRWVVHEGFGLPRRP